jgi:tetratricopeptide (TPR) repeat protein
MAFAGPFWLLSASLAAAAAPPSSPDPTAEAVRAFDTGDYPNAIALAQRRLATAPGDTRALVVRGRAEAALARFEDAYRTFRAVLARQPRDTDALYYVTILGGVLAQAEYDRLLAMSPDSARAHQLLGDLFQAQDRPSDAEAEYKAGLAKAPTSVELLITLGDLTRRQSRFEDALGYYERALRLAPRHFDVLYGLGVTRSYRQEYAQAIEQLRAALRVDGTSAAAHFALGHALLQSGQPALAVPELQTAAAREPRMLQAQYLLGRALSALGRTEEAAAVFEKVKGLVQNETIEPDPTTRPADPLAPARPAPAPSPR